MRSSRAWRDRRSSVAIGSRAAAARVWPAATWPGSSGPRAPWREQARPERAPRDGGAGARPRRRPSARSPRHTRPARRAARSAKKRRLLTFLLLRAGRARGRGRARGAQRGAARGGGPRAARIAAGGLVGGVEGELAPSASLLGSPCGLRARTFGPAPASGCSCGPRRRPSGPGARVDAARARVVASRRARELARRRAHARRRHGQRRAGAGHAGAGAGGARSAGPRFAGGARGAHNGSARDSRRGSRSHRLGRESRAGRALRARRRELLRRELERCPGAGSAPGRRGLSSVSGRLVRERRVEVQQRRERGLRAGAAARAHDASGARCGSPVSAGHARRQSLSTRRKVSSKGTRGSRPVAARSQLRRRRPRRRAERRRAGSTWTRASMPAGASSAWSNAPIRRPTPLATMQRRRGARGRAGADRHPRRRRRRGSRAPSLVPDRETGARRPAAISAVCRAKRGRRGASFSPGPRVVEGGGRARRRDRAQHKRAEQVGAGLGRA